MCVNVYIHIHTYTHIYIYKRKSLVQQSTTTDYSVCVYIYIHMYERKLNSYRDIVVFPGFSVSTISKYIGEVCACVCIYIHIHALSRFFCVYTYKYIYQGPTFVLIS